VPSGLLNRWSIRAFDAVWLRAAPRRRLDEVQTIPQFFHPLDGVHGWNRVYGRHGFVQYQFVVPDGAEAIVRAVMERLRRGGAASFVTVLKRFGPAGPGPLSFPLPGWTLALDLPVTVGLGPVLDACDRLVATAGGRVYLAKDSRLVPELVPVMYPRLDEWRAVRARLDPDGVWQSDLGRRLGLAGGREQGIP
jgi:decaprenylphospho-beta-D-ribofuranose 2-oxidase